MNLKKLKIKRRQYPKINRRTFNKGQAMIEYVVILGVLTSALLYVGNPDDVDSGHIGFSKDDEGSLIQALHDRYTTQTHALSISEAPELTSYSELALYYKSLDKYPELSQKLDDAGVFLNKVTAGLVAVNDGVETLKEYTDPNKAASLIDTDAIKAEVKSQIEDELKEQLKDAIKPF
jgi:hypothetical protein